MSEINYNIHAFLNELASATIPSEADECLSKAIKALGFKKFAYTYYGDDFHSSKKLRYNFSSKALKKWHDHYHYLNYEDVDIIGKQVKTSLLPIIWDVAEQEQITKGKTKQLFTNALTFGLGRGISIPIYGPNNQFSILSIHEETEKKNILENPEITSLLHSYALYYHDTMTHVLVHNIRSHEKSILTKRELQCLTLASRNLTAQETAEKLHIKKRTVDFHIENVNKKLKTKNKFESIQLAISKHLIEP